MGRKQELVGILERKYEAVEFWGRLRSCVKMSTGKLAKLEEEIAAIRTELEKIREEGEPVDEKKIETYALFATITMEEYSSEVKEDTISLMKKSIIEKVGHEGLHEWSIVEHRDIVEIDNESEVTKGMVSPKFLIGTILPYEETPVMHLGLKVKKEVNIV